MTVWASPGTLLEVRNSSWGVCEVRYFYHLHRDFSYPFPHVPVLFSRSPQVREMFTQLVLEAGRVSPGEESAVVYAMELAATAMMARGDPRPTRTGLPRVIAERLVEYAENQVGRNLHVQDLAMLAGLSPDYFSRAFRLTFGVSPRTWIVRSRVQHAARLLSEQSMSVAEVARACGYNDPYLFSRQFKSIMGTAPRDYRTIAGPAHQSPTENACP
ncbi:AraC family transcriptional regulator [Streptomyces microflavus]|uniref:helix-turn-helix domain-containing protein n=1 Tax=Streptomyces microflavus TaxID=1919 RepID=UPI0033B52E6E